MNKFVKGAKNLAFALSFVTVAACGNVKKAELEAGLKNLEKKIGDKLVGKADTGTVNTSQAYVRMNEVLSQTNALEEKIAVLKKETVSLDVLKKSFVNDWVTFTQIFGFVPGVSGDKKIEKCELTFSFDNGGKATFKILGENSVEIVKDESEKRVLGCKDFMFIEGFMKMGGRVKLDDLKFDNEENDDNKVKFAGKEFNLAEKGEFDFLKFLVGICVANNKGFKDLGLDKIVVDNKAFSGKDLKACKNYIDDFIALFNSVVEGCCVKEGNSVKFVKNKGWMKSSSAPIDGDVLVPFDN